MQLIRKEKYDTWETPEDQKAEEEEEEEEQKSNQLPNLGWNSRLVWQILERERCWLLLTTATAWDRLNHRKVTVIQSPFGYLKKHKKTSRVQAFSVLNMAKTRLLC